MSEQPSEALRTALNEMERLRRRSLWMTRFMIACSIACWIAAYVMILLRGNIGMGLVLGLNTVMCAVFALAISMGAGIYANSMTILKAIESLRPPTPASPPDRR